MRHLHLPLSLGLGALLGGLGCQGYTFEQKCPEGITESQVTVPAAKPVPADILFVVDNSGSMADEQANLAANFEFFINQIQGSGDYQIAIVTTDQSGSPPEKAGLIEYTYLTSHPYQPAIGNNYNSACYDLPDIAHGCFRGPNPDRRIIRSTQPASEQISDFQANVMVGSCGSGTETGLKSMRAALEQTGPSQCNSGFLRPDANLVVIFVSDEEDTDNTPIGQYVQDLVGFKDPSKVRIAAIVGSVDGDASQCSVNEGAACGSLCQTPPPEGSGTQCTSTSQCPNEEYCDVGARRCRDRAQELWNIADACRSCSYYNVEDCCTALSGGRYIQFARSVESRVVAADVGIGKTDCKAPEGTRTACLVDSICQESFGATLERIAKDLVVTSLYNLDPVPENPSGVAVKVKGGRFGAGVDLEYGTDFSITVAADGLSAVLKLENGEIIPSMEGEDLDIAYVSDISRPTEQKGACGPNTSTTALSRQ